MTSYQNNNRNDTFEPTFYSPYRMNNGDSAVDKTCLTLNYWKQMLKISINPRKNTGDNGDMLFDMENNISIFLNHTKAAILSNELKNFLKDRVTYNGAGVSTAQGVITVSNGSEFGVETPILIIRKLDEVGNVISSFAYEFKTNFHFSIRNYNGGKDFVKDFESYNDLELKELILVLDEFCKATTYATSYTVNEKMRYNQDKMQGTINSIAEKLGIEVPRSGMRRRSGYSSTSAFINGAGSTTSTEPKETENYIAATLDDID